MSINHEDFQKARRISRAIQEYLELINKDGLRSTDLYPYLAKKKLIEKDRHNGLHFRKFLKKLKNHDLLELIPQCHYNSTSSEFLEWHFYRIKDDTIDMNSKTESEELILPKLSDDEINELIKKAKPHIDKLPKVDISKLTYQQKELRKLYERAYEIWTAREIEIMIRAYRKFGKIDKVAELLRRQPSVVEKKLKEKNIDNNI